MKKLLVSLVLGAALALAACEGSKDDGDALAGQDAVTTDEPAAGDVKKDTAKEPGPGVETGGEDPGTQQETADDPGTQPETGKDPGTQPETGEDPGTNPDEGTPPAGGCPGIMACANEKQCQTQACLQECLDAADAPAQADFAALIQCAQKNCMALKGSAQVQCIYDTCRETNEKCVTVGTDNCQNSIMCLQKCGQSAACQQGCVDKATYDAMLGVLALMVCIEANCPTTGDCAQTKCNTELQACLAP
ncbi:MAG: hypothetical protein FJ087_13530 [Deltaproteobacteria bacterium]|nr:hypothetical protein [Deltaproteobacteria bacterium]